MSIRELVAQIQARQAQGPLQAQSRQAPVPGVAAAARSSDSEAEAAGPDAGGAQELRFIIESEQRLDPAELARQVSAAYGIAARAEPAFPGSEDPELARLTLLRIPGPAEDEVRSSPFDLAYDLQDRFGFQRVEPDLATEFFPAEPDRLAVAMGAGDILDCWVNGESPPDKGWAPRLLKAPEAWTRSENTGKPARGKGILIAQIDTGYTTHPELQGALDPAKGRDILDNDADATDPLVKVLPTDNPGHGTATASVAVSRGTITAPDGSGTGGPGEVTGTAPAATLVPIRAIRSVVRLTQLNVARAITYAADQQYPIITMSLGGLPSIALWMALRSAVSRNILIMAAAGNCVREVVFPARYENCLAVAGINARGKPWKGSSRGPAVDVSAPAELVWRATAKRENGAPVYGADGTGEGTSFAVAMTAGVAALWLAHHGRDDLIGKLAGGETLLDRFRTLIKSTARKPSGWDAANFGAGIVDADALLKRAVPRAAVLPHMAAAGTRGDSYADLVDAVVTDPGARAVLSMAAAPTTGLSRAEKEKYGLEIIWHIYRARLAAARQVPVAVLAQSAGTAPPAVSGQLAAVLGRPGTDAVRRLMLP